MSKKIIFKGALEECYLPGEPKLLQLNLQEPKIVEPATVCCFFLITSSQNLNSLLLFLPLLYCF